MCWVCVFVGMCLPSSPSLVKSQPAEHTACFKFTVNRVAMLHRARTDGSYKLFSVYWEPLFLESGKYFQGATSGRTKANVKLFTDTELSGKGTVPMKRVLFVFA